MHRCQTILAYSVHPSPLHLSQYSRAIRWEVGDIRGVKRAQNSWKICAKKETNKKRCDRTRNAGHERRA